MSESAPTNVRPSVSVAAVVLAAGLSRRAGPVNKLLADIDGRPMIARVVEAAVTAGLSPVLVVTGHEAKQVADALAGLPVTLVDNPDFAEGMAASIRHGIAALPGTAAGAMICLGDMPWVRAETLAQLAAAFAAAAGHTICRPVYDGEPGNPVVFARRHFAELRALAGDRGAKAVIQAHPDALLECAVDDPGVLRDLDNPQT